LRPVSGGALTPYFLALLADAYARIGAADQALTALAEALIITEQTHEGYMEAELHRLKGELVRDPEEAEACFQQAIDIARRQKAKSFELRAVMSLSRVYRKVGRQNEARQMLAEIYGWFTEGFDTGDLKDAAALLEEMSAHARSRRMHRRI
jgi:predicted ATPase